MEGKTTLKCYFRFAGKWSLLPLAPKEEKLVTDKGDWQMSAFEKQNFCKGIMPVLLNIIGK